MDEPFPTPPKLAPATAQGLVNWLEAMASWLSADHDAARAAGHQVTGQTLRNLQLYQDAALLFRESYGLLD